MKNAELMKRNTMNQISTIRDVAGTISNTVSPGISNAITNVHACWSSSNADAYVGKLGGIQSSLGGISTNLSAIAGDMTTTAGSEYRKNKNL